MHPLQIPEKVRRTAGLLGEAGHVWLANLPQRIVEIERRWAIKVGQPFRNGTEALVAEACTSEGQDVVLKMVIPGIDPTHQEICILRGAKSRGYAKLIRADDDKNIMLLERLGPPLQELGLPPDGQVEIICATLHDAWMPLPDGPPFATAAEKAVELARVIESNWSALGKPCSERTIDLALSYAEKRRLAFDTAQSVLVHGDAHQWNLLRAPGSAHGFKFIDPDGLLAERAFDLAIPMREWGSVLPDGDLLHLGRTAVVLAGFAGVDEQPIWEWSMIQCVSNGMLLKQIGFDGPASVEFAMAEAWAAV